jgi:LEA14-like dessication related protein
MFQKTPYLLGFSAIFCSGCEVISENPYLSQLISTIAFDGFQVNHVSFEEVDTEFLFAIDNPNPIGIDIEDFSYSLAFADIDWMDGDDPNGLLLGASGLSQVSLPTHIVFSDLYDMVQATRGMDHIPFGLNGDFGLRLDSSTFVTEESESSESDAEVVHLPYDADGDFPALRRPKINLQKLKVRNISFSEINLDLIMDVDNDHASNLIFERFSYDLTLGGESVVTGLIQDLSETIHGEEVDDTERNKRLSVPITIDNIATIGSIWEFFQNGRNLNVDFAAVTDVDTPFGLMELQIDETGNVDVEVQ